jgi:hypothetical protein
MALRLIMKRCLTKDRMGRTLLSDAFDVGFVPDIALG